jgi:GWxTD domain-containing protein
MALNMSPVVIALWFSVALAGSLTACGRSHPPSQAPTPDQQPTPRATAASQTPPSQPEAVKLYRQMGLLAEGGDTPFIGSISLLGSKFSDSTLFVLTVSVPSRGLTFVRENDRYRASYSATLTLTPSNGIARRFESHQIVRVAAFKETSRSDESVLYQQMVMVQPGAYDLGFSLRDDAGAKGSSIEANLNVPRIRAGSLSSPIPVYDAVPRSTLDSLPQIVPTPKATYTLGQDSALSVYLEGYAADSAKLLIRAAVFGENTSTPVWSDTVSLARHDALFSGVISVPIARLGIGPLTMTAVASGRSDTTKTPIFITFGEDLPVATFSEMVSYLRYFGSSARLQALRDAPPDARAGVWAAFLRETDPDPATPVNEAMRDYFGRIAEANGRFREEGETGWLTDRGRVFVALGAPDQYYEPNTTDMNQRGRTQVWDYRRHRLQIVFTDQTGFGRWRMTVGSEADFDALVRRELSR